MPGGARRNVPYYQRKPTERRFNRSEVAASLGSGCKSSSPEAGPGRRRRAGTCTLTRSPGPIWPAGMPSITTPTASAPSLPTSQHVLGRGDDGAHAERVRRDHADDEALEVPGQDRAAGREVVAGRPGRRGRDQPVAGRARDLLARERVARCARRSCARRAGSETSLRANSRSRPCRAPAPAA